MMGDADTLRLRGWTPDPADRVAVVPVHDPRCAERRGGGCGCRPRLELRLVTGPHDPDADDRAVELRFETRRAG